MPTHHSTAPAQTAALGRALAADARPGEVWALVGDLGAGKTHFVQGIVRGIGAPGPATSPTFALIHEYLHLAFRDHPNGRDEAFIEQLAGRLVDS